MTQISLIIRTVAAMMVIFASGVRVGHTLFPRETVVEIPVSVTNGVQKEELPPPPTWTPERERPENRRALSQDPQSRCEAIRKIPPDAPRTTSFGGGSPASLKGTGRVDPQVSREDSSPVEARATGRTRPNHARS